MRYLLFIILALLVASPSFADVGLKDSPSTFSSLKRYPIPDSTIGQKGNTYISPVGSTPATKFAKTPSGGLGRNLLRFGKFVGKLSTGGAAWKFGEIAMGEIMNPLIDLGKAYLDKQMQKRPELLDALDDILGNTPDSLQPGSKMKCSESSYGEVYRVDGPHLVCPSADELASSGITCSGTYRRFVRDPSNDYRCGSPGRESAYNRTIYHVRPTIDIDIDLDLNLDLGLGSPVRQYPDSLSDDQLKSLADKLDELLQKNDQLANDIADALDDLINKNPEYLDWDPIPSRDFEDALLQDKIDETLQARSNATDPGEIRRLDDLLEKLANQKNRLDLNRQKEDEDQKKKADKTPDTDNCSDNNNNCNNNNCNNNCNNCPDGKCEVECKVEETPFEPPEVPKPELKEIDFQPITDLQGKLMAKFPFCLLQTFSSALDVLSASPRAPHCELNLGISTINFDLSFLDSFAAFIRAVMSFCIFGLCGFGLFRMWSRF